MTVMTVTLDFTEESPLALIVFVADNRGIPKINNCYKNRDCYNSFQLSSICDNSFLLEVFGLLISNRSHSSTEC